MNATSAVDKIINIAHALSTENAIENLLVLFVEGSMSIANADACTLYTIDEQDPKRLLFRVIRNNSLNFTEDRDKPMYVSLYSENGEPSSLVSAQTFLQRKTINIINTYEDHTDFDFAGTHAFDKQFNYRSESFLSIPLISNQDEIIGVLQLINALDDDKNPRIFDERTCYLVQSIASMASTAMAKQQLVEGQKQLFESFVTLIAKAIDLKSPVTSKHCQNVPAIAIELAKSVHDWNEGSFAHIRWSADELYELQVAAWLHDCGKLTTSELVIDKATKLHTQFDRIELIEKRFELYKQHLELEYYRVQHLFSPQTLDQKKAVLDKTLLQLDQDFAFIQHCNIGKETMAEEDKTRVHELGKCTWQDNKGNSHSLLTDDEVAFLCITRGTLSDEERQKMRGHMTATWEMLASLPYPTNLKNVPDIAGNHHEHLNGTGYPRGLRADQLSIRDRIMCIADIFEALTAPDRPYKAGMKLSQALRIMAQRVKANHLDRELFEVFILSGAYKRYANGNIAPHQCDTVDEDAILAACF